MIATRTVDVGWSKSFCVGRMGVKLFVREPDKVDRTAFIPIFHRWIQQGLFDRRLVDVADYRHVHHGPGVMLIAHEGQYSMDEGEGRLGLRYEQTKHDGSEGRERLRHVFHATLTACQQLEREEKLRGTVQFWTDQMLFRLTDRLLAPSTEETYRMWRPVLEDALRDLYRDTPFELERDTAGGISGIRITARASPDIAVLAERLSS